MGGGGGGGGGGRGGRVREYMSCAPPTSLA